MKQISYFIKDTETGRQLRKENNYDFLSHRKLGTTVLNDGYVLLSRAWHDGGRIDGGVTDTNHNYIASTGYTSTGGCGYDFDDNTASIGDRCIFIGSIHPVYGHAITDTLRKLWFLKTAEGQRMIDEGYQVVFITTMNSELPKWQYKIFELAGLDPSLLTHVRQTTRYNTIVVPDDSLGMEDGRRQYTKVFCTTIDEIKQNAVKHIPADKHFPENLYFTRTRCNLMTREMGEPELEKMFRRHGFTIISPERHSIEEQIVMLMQCKRFAATECSCSHAAIFCNPDCEVIILRKADYVNKYSSMIADMLGNRTVFVDANKSTMANPSLPMLGPFFLCVTPELIEYMDIGTNNSKDIIGGGICQWFKYKAYIHSHKKTIHYAIRVYDKVRRELKAKLNYSTSTLGSSASLVVRSKG